MITNTVTKTIPGMTIELKRYFVQIGRNGELSKKPQYGVTLDYDSKDGMTAGEFVTYLTKKIAYKFEKTPHIEKKAAALAQALLTQLETSNDGVEVRPRRVDCGAPSLGRTGIPTRPLAYA